MMICYSLETIEDGTHILVERIADLEATIERLRQDIGWRDRHIDAMEDKLERT